MEVLGFRLTALSGESVLLEPGHAMQPGGAAAPIESILARTQSLCANKLYFDLAEVEVIDRIYLAYLNRLARACRCVGIRMICIHLKPSTAFGLAGLERVRIDFETAYAVERQAD